MYRPDIKVIDCTIRDGGLMNNWEFSKPMVKVVFDGLAKAGVDYAELGYRVDKKQFDPKDHGPWRFCDEEDLREVAYECDTKISVMVDVGRTDYDTFLPKDQSIVSMFRVASYVKEIDKAIHLARHVMDHGYEVPYMITGIMNKHPRTALAFMQATADGNQDKSFVDFVNEHGDVMALD